MEHLILGWRQSQVVELRALNWTAGGCGFAALLDDGRLRQRFAVTPRGAIGDGSRIPFRRHSTATDSSHDYVPIAEGDATGRKLRSDHVAWCSNL